MRRSLVSIAVIGILALVAMGLLAKVFVEQNPEILALSRFKAQSLERFGLDEISVRRRGRTFEFRVCVDDGCVSRTPPRDLARGIGEYYLEAYQGDSRVVDRSVRVVILPDRGVGCRKPRPILETEIDLDLLRRDRSLRELAGKIREDAGLRGLEIRAEPGGRLVATVDLPGAGAKDPEEVASAIPQVVRRTGMWFREARVTVRSPDGKVMLDRRYDPRGRPLGAAAR